MKKNPTQKSLKNKNKNWLLELLHEQKNCCFNS
jgi:hypothetical protein